MQEPIKDDKSEVTRMGVLSIQVCSALSEDEALEWVREACPAGISNNWVKTHDPVVEPVACSNGNGRTHYVYTC